MRLFSEEKARLKAADRAAALKALHAALENMPAKIVVLDDDPTGCQTVHDISVYTGWEYEDVLEGFREEKSMFFILTNSRGMRAEESAALHEKLAINIARASRETGRPFAVVSRGDSTLRGHYPMETQVLARTIAQETGRQADGEIIMPFFAEGGRYTIDDVHYVAMGDELIPAGETEFARDKTFGYTKSDLTEWIIEKHGGYYNKEDIFSVPLDMLRSGDLEGIKNILRGMHGFQKCIVNAVEQADAELFAAALADVIGEGRLFIMRSAAALPKALGGVDDRPLLESDELRDKGNENGGLVIAGSHVQKTTLQLAALREMDGLEWIEMNQHLVVDEAAFAAEQARVIAEAERAIASGRTAVVYTRRERFDLNSDDKQQELVLALRISDAVTGVVEKLGVRPAFIIAKGGITSSEIGTKALRVRRANVMGQILPGVPVWHTGAESKFPGLPYVIFPGNVGSETALREAVEKLIRRDEK